MIDGRVVTFSPGEDISRPQSIILRATGQRRTYVYNANGLLSEIRYEVCTDLNTLNVMGFDPMRPDDCVRTNPEQVWLTSERFIYDAIGRPTRYIDREQNIAVFAYDDASNLINYQNVAGQTFNYVYNEINQLVSITGPTGTRLILRYDPLG